MKLRNDVRYGIMDDILYWEKVKKRAEKKIEFFRKKLRKEI